MTGLRVGSEDRALSVGVVRPASSRVHGRGCSDWTPAEVGHVRSRGEGSRGRDGGRGGWFWVGWEVSVKSTVDESRVVGHSGRLKGSWTDRRGPQQ